MEDEAMTTLHSGFDAVDITPEPDGRIRLTLTRDGETLACPTFPMAAFLAAIPQSNGVPS